MIVCLIAVVFLSAGVRHLQFSTNDRAFFGDNNPEVIALRDLEDAFSSSNSVLIQLVPESGNVFEPEFLTALRKFTNDSWLVPHNQRSNSLTNFSHTRAEEDEIIVEPLIPDDDEITDEIASNARQISLSSPELVNNLVSEAGDAAGISIIVALPKGNKNAISEVVNHVAEMKNRWLTQYPMMEINLTGGVYAGLTFAEAAKRDLLSLVPVAVGVAFILLILGLGSIAAIISTFLTMIFATLSGLGFAGYIGIELTPGTATSPLAVMVLVVASCVHILLNWRRGIDEGLSSQDAMRTAISENLTPVTVANFTTAIGFLCLQYSESPPLQEMGMMVAMGLIIGWALSLVFLPTVCVVLPASLISWLKPSTTLLEALGDFTSIQRKPLVAIFGILLAIAITGVFRIGFEDNFIRYFDETYEFRRDADAIEKRLTGLSVIQYSFDSGKERGVFDPEFLNAIEAFSVWLEAQPEVLRVNSITHLFKRLNKSMNNDDDRFLIIADEREQNAQFMMFYELSLPVGQDLNTTMNVDRSKTRISVVMRNASSEDIRNIAENSEKWFDNQSHAFKSKATGFTLVFARISKRNNHAMLTGMILALILVSGILVLALRDIKFGLISLVPNLTPAIFAFGLWGYTFTNVNLGSSVVTTMTFGIVVDDTVHFLMGYQRRRNQYGEPPQQAIRSTIKTVGHALILTSIVIAVGFILMAMSSFQINEHVGWLTAFVVIIALICDLLLLPPLLLLSEWKRK